MQKSYALDTSILIVHYYKRNLSYIVEKGFINLHTLSEIFYVICRAEGLDNAVKYVKELLKMMKIVPSNELVYIAGQFKCKYRISLADAWTLATAKVKKVPALFAVKEKEIINIFDELKREVEIEFLYTD